jgi:hypothetical protein
MFSLSVPAVQGAWTHAQRQTALSMPDMWVPVCVEGLTPYLSEVEQRALLESLRLE